MKIQVSKMGVLVREEMISVAHLLRYNLSDPNHLRSCREATGVS